MTAFAFSDCSSKRQLVESWRRSFNALGVGIIAPAPRIFLTPSVALTPDFYLPIARQHCIVLLDRDISHADELLMLIAAQHAPRREWVNDDTAPDLPVIGLFQGGLAIGWERGDRCGVTGLALCQCAKCRHWWFCDRGASWICQCCGAYDGNAGLLNSLDSPLTPFPAVASPELF